MSISCHNHTPMSDTFYMRRCLLLASCGLHTVRPNPMVGAVVVAHDGGQARIIGSGWHMRYGEAHAEVNALASIREEDEPLLSDAIMYVSLEPCSHWGKTPPCADLIVRKGIANVVVGCMDRSAKVNGRGIERLREAGINVRTGVLEEECRWLNRRFFTFQQLQRPYIIIKWAQTADGLIDDHFSPMRISNPYALRISHRLRAEEEAIVVGHTTALRDSPRLTVRHWSGSNPRPFILADDTTIQSLLDDCRRAGIQSLIVEGGSTTHQSFLDAGLWDEARIETAPLHAGGGTRAANLPADAIPFGFINADGHAIRRYINPSTAERLGQNRMLLRAGKPSTTGQ